MLDCHTALVIAAHPDDELLGCGGTIARLVQAGKAVKALILTNGDSERRQSAIDAINASVTLGALPPHLHDFPDQRLDRLALKDLAGTIAFELEGFQPDLVLTHHPGDLNQDHKAVAAATLVATRPMPGQTVRQLYTYETLSASEWEFGSSPFAPNTYVDISSTLGLKLKAFAVYKNEVREFPHPRSLQSIEALARLRGSTVGLNAAEAFNLLRRYC